MRSTKKMILATLIGVLAIGSIGYSAVSKTSRKKAANKTAVTSKNLTRKFSCSSRNVTVENLSTNKVRLTDDSGKVYNLKLTRSASGELYSGNGVSIQIKGNDAVFTASGNDIDGKTTEDDKVTFHLTTDYSPYKDMAGILASMFIRDIGL